MCGSPHRNTVLFGIANLVLAGGAMAQLQTADPQVQTITQLVDQVAFGAQILQLSDPQSTQEELPGLGHKFELLGVMMRDSDPQNPAGKSGGAGGGAGGNEGISATTTPTTIAVALRNTPPGVKITAFRNQLGLKYLFESPRTCGGGSPRITLLVDANGDGFVSPAVDPTSPDFAAHGHVNPPVYTACLQGLWRYEDMTDQNLRWEVTPGGAAGPTIPVFPFVPWSALETAVSAFLNHRIVAGLLVDDSCSFFPAACGKAHYDLVTIENRTLEIWQDTVKKN